MGDAPTFVTISVALERNMTEKELEPLLTAIKQMRGVVAVIPGTSTPRDFFARATVRAEILAKILEIFGMELES